MPADRTSERMLMLLKTRGELTTRALADALEISVPAVRQHLKSQAQFIEMRRRSEGVGRPAQVWSLNAAAQQRFPDTHSELTVRLIDTIEKTMGAAGLEKIIKHRFEENLQIYSEHLNGVQSLNGRLKRLTAMRAREGYMASLERDGETWLLTEAHCPICAAASRCQGFCSNELKLFETLLGDDVEVIRSEYLLAGGQRCSYVIRRKATV
ncbi:MAG: ArsR family transcriptional regulator [Proteobacteria bacterium]|nr:ArsR family transcriptional regulator [Pseudomonadota bacterium]